MKRLLISAMLVTLSIATFAGPVAASSSTVRLPKSAADWATFTQTEKQAAYSWVNTHETTAPSTVVATAPAVSKSSGVQPMVSASFTAGGECGYSVQNYSTGSRVAAWSQVHASQRPYWMDTGMQGYVDQLWRNGAQSYTTYGGTNTTYVYATTSYDWKWYWENVHYNFQAWDSVETSAGVWYWKNAYCNVSYDA